MYFFQLHTSYHCTNANRKFEGELWKKIVVYAGSYKRVHLFKDTKLIWITWVNLTTPTSLTYFIDDTNLIIMMETVNGECPTVSLDGFRCICIVYGPWEGCQIKYLHPPVTWCLCPVQPNISPGSQLTVQSVQCSPVPSDFSTFILLKKLPFKHFFYSMLFRFNFSVSGDALHKKIIIDTFPVWFN